MVSLATLTAMMMCGILTSVVMIVVGMIVVGVMKNPRVPTKIATLMMKGVGGPVAPKEKAAIKTSVLVNVLVRTVPYYFVRVRQRFAFQDVVVLATRMQTVVVSAL